MTLKTIAFAFLVFVLSLQPFSALAAESELVSSQALALCHTNEECIVTEAMCPNTWLAINKKFKDVHAARVTKMRADVECATANIQIAKPDNALCIENKCEIAQSLNMSQLPGMYDCTTAQDCVVTEGICPSWWIAVNKMRLTEQEASVAKNRPIVRCKASPSPDKPAAAFCVEKKCDIKDPGAKP